MLEQAGKDEYREIQPDPEGRMVMYRPRTYKVNGLFVLNEYHFCLPTSTPPAIHSEGRLMRPVARSLLVFRPGIPYRLEAGSHAKEFMSIRIEAAYFDQTIREAFGSIESERMKCGHRAGSALVSLLQRIEAEAQREADANPLMLQCLRTELIIELYRTACGQTFPTARQRKGGSDGIAAAIAFMSANYSANISLNDISHHACMSPYYFSRRFRERMGITPHRYLLEVRLKAAEDMLNRNGWTIEEVAHHCGFVSATHFSVAFRNQVGMTPSAYRERVINLE